MNFKSLSTLLIPVGFLFAAGCGSKTPVTYQQLIEPLTNRTAFASLDEPATELICSYDLTGKNEDYNHFQGEMPNGEPVLADLKGPGLVSRFWFTGIRPDSRIFFYFDNEESPRLSFTWNELRQGVPPFDIIPLSIDEQNCWHTFVPIPFEKRLVITTEDQDYQYGKGPKFYYQLNWQPLPKNQTIASMTFPPEASTIQALEQVASSWRTPTTQDMLPDPLPAQVIPPDTTATLWQHEGNTTINTLTLTPDFSQITSAHARDQLLRDIIINIYWDHMDPPSVQVPLGDFFGSVWQRWRAESLYFGSVDDTFFSKFPMPFAKHARIEIENRSPVAVPMAIGVDYTPGKSPSSGYFHAEWRNSPASATGSPHIVLGTEGKGRFAGCLLSVVSADKSFWVLESDESMIIDGKLAWHGTGLEDYFNAGWYYGNVFARPLHGLPIKAPFRTVQYRLHPTDPVIFDKSFRMQFERGPDHASHGAYESVAWFYLAEPQAVNSTLLNRDAPIDQVQPYTLMTDLWSFERFNDLQGQRDYIDRYLETYRPAFTETLAMRKLNIDHKLGTIDRKKFIEELDRIKDSTTNQLVTAYADALSKLHSNTNAVLVQFYANMQSELYLNGSKILEAGNPQQPTFTVVVLPPGEHVIAAASAAQNYPAWTQVAIVNADGYILGTDVTWQEAVNPSGNWMMAEYDTTDWILPKNYNARVKGPPEEPYVWVNPDPFINTLSHASGIRPSTPWPDKRGRIIYRKSFQIESPQPQI